MVTATRTKVNAKVDIALRDEWLRTVDGLAGQIAEWVRQEPEWSFVVQEVQDVEGPLLGQYLVTVWGIYTPDGEVRLEPKEQDFLGRQFVELYVWPTLRRVYLLPALDGQGWRVRTDSGIFLRQAWNCENFILLIRDLIEAD